MHVLGRHDIDARRAQQYCGTESSADVLAPSLPLHIEVKSSQTLSVEAGLQQVTKDAGEGGQTPTLWHRKNGEQLKVTLWADDFIAIAKKAFV